MVKNGHTDKSLRCRLTDLAGALARLHARDFVALVFMALLAAAILVFPFVIWNAVSIDDAAESPAAVQENMSSLEDDSGYSVDFTNTYEEPVDEGAQQPTTPTVSQPKPSNLANVLPYQGLSEEWIDETWLGTHYAYDPEPCDDYRQEGSTRYYWTAENGTNDLVFTAYVRDGAVIDTRRENGWTDYWPDINGLPDLHATGAQVISSSRDAFPDEDPVDYRSPDDYADSAADWFAEQGYEDPWQAAYEYWENTAG